MARNYTELDAALTAVENLRGSSNFETMLANINTATGGHYTNLTAAIHALIESQGSTQIDCDTGVVTPYSNTNLHIPFNTSKIPFFYMAYSMDGIMNSRAAVAAGICAAEHNSLYPRTVNIACYASGGRIVAYGLQDSAFSPANGYIDLERAGTNGSYGTGDMWTYMVFYAPASMTGGA